MVVDLDNNRTLARQNADELMMPASNMKLFTTASALGVLGEDFVFETKLRMIDEKTIIVRGDGDPAFGDPKILWQTPLAALNGTPYEGQKIDIELMLRIWIDQIRKAGVKRIERLIIDDRIFDQKTIHPTWPEDQLHKWYCAQVAGLNFNTNCVDIYATPTKIGRTPRIRIVPHTKGTSFLSVTNRTVTGDSDTFWVSRKISTNQLTFSGKVRIHRKTPVWVTVHDPAMFFGNVLASRLINTGVAVDMVTRPKADEILPRGKTLHVIRTPITDVVNRCNKDSQNLYAEALLKRMGRQITGAPGSWENGSAAMRIFLREKLGTHAARVQPADGSGLSRNNRITARVMIDLLGAMHRDRKIGPAFKASLAVAGKDGSLKKYFTTGMNGDVHGKTGYINFVRTLSGYLFVPGEKGETKTIAFSILFNDIKPPALSHQILKLRNDLVYAIDKHTAPRKAIPKRTAVESAP